VEKRGQFITLTPAVAVAMRREAWDETNGEQSDKWLMNEQRYKLMNLAMFRPPIGYRLRGRGRKNVKTQ
jgi:hypothetical protein